MNNIARNPGFSQVLVWPSTLVEGKIKEFEALLEEELGCKIQYLEEIKTYPDKDECGNSVAGTGDRNDVFFAVADNYPLDLPHKRLLLGMRWIEDVLSTTNYTSPIYPERVFEYKSW